MGAALLWLLAGLFLAAVASVFALPWFWPRPAAPDIPDPRRPAPEPNGFDVLREAVDQMPPPAVAEERQPADPALEAALAALDRAVAMEDWWWPSDDAPGLEPGASLKVMMGVQRLVRIKNERSKARAEAGDLAGAVEDARGMVRLGERLAGGCERRQDWQVGTACTHIGLAALCGVLGPSPPDTPPANDPTVAWPLPPLGDAGRAALQDALAELDTLRPAETLADVLAIEHHQRLDDLAGRQRRRRRTVFLDVPHTAALSAALTAEVVKQCRRPRSERDLTRCRALSRQAAWPTGHWWPSYNEVGRMELAGLRNVADSLPERVDQARLQLAYTRTALALRLYVDDHGRLPEMLDALVDAGYLGTVPLDPSTGEPLGYDPRQGRLSAASDAPFLRTMALPFVASTSGRE